MKHKNAWIINVFARKNFNVALIAVILMNNVVKEDKIVNVILNL